MPVAWTCSARFLPEINLGGQFVIGGRYSAGLQTGFGLAALAQTGTIPVDSHSLIFDAIGDKFLVSLDGSTAQVFHLGEATTPSGVNYDTYGVDVSSFVGKEIEIKFSSAPNDQGMTLDNIRFSSTVTVPEPGLLFLICVGGGALYIVIGRGKLHFEDMQ